MTRGYGVNDGFSIAPDPAPHLQDQGPSSATPPTAHMPLSSHLNFLPKAFSLRHVKFLPGRGRGVGPEVLPTVALAAGPIVAPAPIVGGKCSAEATRDCGARGLKVQPRHRAPDRGPASETRLRRVTKQSRCCPMRCARTKGSVCWKRRSKAATLAASMAALARTRANGVWGASYRRSSREPRRSLHCSFSDG